MLKQNQTKNEKKQNWKKCYCTLNTVFISLCLHDSVCVFFLHLHCSRSKWNKANHSKWKTKKKPATTPNTIQNKKYKWYFNGPLNQWCFTTSRHLLFSPSLNLVHVLSIWTFEYRIGILIAVDDATAGCRLNYITQTYRKFKCCPVAVNEQTYAKNWLPRLTETQKTILNGRLLESQIADSYELRTTKTKGQRNKSRE